VTEEEWLGCADPVALLRHLSRPRGDRKLLLYGVACCRGRWDLLTHRYTRGAVEWAERFADGSAVRDEEYARLEWNSEGAAFAAEAARAEDWADDWEAGPGRLRGRACDAARLPRAEQVVSAAYLANSLMSLECVDPYDPALSRHRPLLTVPFLRDVFGNPFRPVTFDPSWRSDTAVSLAKGMYDGRDFAAMPILADALQDAGCEDEQVLAHCRDPRGVHVRGCWVVDLVLGRS
jgi:hypothetical protein